MTKKEFQLKLDGKKYISLFGFLLVFIVIYIAGLVYFQGYAKHLVRNKQVERVMSYTVHNASIANSVLNNENEEANLKKYLYNSNENVFIVDKDGNIKYTINNNDKVKTKNIFTLIKNYKKSDDSVKAMKKSMSNGKDQDSLNLVFNNESSIICYKQVKNNENLYVISTLSNKLVMSGAQNVILRVLILIIVVTVGCFIASYLYFRKQKKCNEVLKDLVNKDELTGHISYSKFLIKAEDLINQNKNKKIAVYYGDIKNFKYINDTYGYDVGDKLIIHTTNVIQELLGDEGYFSRISADNFTVIRTYENKEDFIEKIYTALDRISDFSEFKKENYKVGIYVGVYCNEDSTEKTKLSEMIDRANMAQKSIKGSNEYHLAFYNEEIRERIIAEKEIEKKMESALEKGEFVVFYQPKYSVKSGEISGAEALVRWNSPERGLLLPSKFIPLFEQNGFIVNLDQYVFESVCKTVREWLDNGRKVVSISINVSRIQFYRLDFVKRYTKIKQKYDIPDGLLELEFTESIVLENIELLQKIVNNLKENGFICSIDDFGSGYSSLNILKNLPMDILKLDKLFFKNSENLDRDKALIASVVTMARALKMKTVSEGIETWNQVNFLKEIGCDIIQGYVYSEPISKNRFEHLVEGKKKRVPEPIVDEKELDTKDILLDKDNFVYKYIAALKYSSSTVIESDYTLDKFRVVNIVNVGNYDDIKTEDTNITESFTKLIEKYVHPDDKSSVKQRCLPMGVMSSFYQGEEKIISDFRILDNDLEEYIWCRATIVKVQTDDDKSYRSITFLDNIDEIINLNKYKVATIKTIEDALYEMCGMIFEFNYQTDKYNLLYYRKSKLGDQPENGDLSWLRRQYLKKVVYVDDLVQLQNFLNPINIEEQFKLGKSKITTQARILINEDIGYTTCNITLIKIYTSDDSIRVFAMCQNIEEIYTNCEKTKAFEMYINNAICDYYDLVYIADIKNDEFQVVQAHHMFSKVCRNIKYTKFLKKFNEKFVFYEDKEKMKKFMNPANIDSTFKIGKSGDSIEYRIVKRLNGNESISKVCTTYMRIPCASNKIIVMSRALDDSLSDGSKLENDPLKNLYKKETTNLIIERVLQKLDFVDKRAFLLLDISKIESLSDDDKWEYHTKEDILEEFNERILDILSDTEVMCRTGGYEFIIVSDKAEKEENIRNRADQLCNLLKEPLAIDFKEYKITGNIGISTYGKDGIDYERLYMSADNALTKARSKGPDGYCIYK